MKTSNRQDIFRTTFVGILLYSVVLGFFNDYTDVLQTSSYSATFGAAIVLQILTHATLQVKDWVKLPFKGKKGGWNTTGLVLSVWLVLFLSKFVFLAVIDYVFGDNVTISGFVGLLAIVVVLTIAQKLAEITYEKLAD